MGSLNKVLLIGNLGRDAELRYTPAGAAVLKFSLATTDTWTDKGGQKQERTEWHNADYWGKPAEAVAEYLKKGKQVYLEGQLLTEEYTDKDGVKRRTTKVRVQRLVLLGSGSGERRESQGQARAGEYPRPAEDITQQGPLEDDDIPF